MEERPKPIKPRVPRRPHRPQGTAAAADQAPENPDLAFELVIRGGVGAVPAVWEE